MILRGRSAYNADPVWVEVRHGREKIAFRLDLEAEEGTTDSTEGTDRYGQICGHPFDPFDPRFLFSIDGVPFEVCAATKPMTQATRKRLEMANNVVFRNQTSTFGGGDFTGG